MTERVRFGDPRVDLSANQRNPQLKTIEAVRLPVEVGGRPFMFTVTLGSITEAPADAILIPSNPWFGLVGGGAVEYAIHRDAGQAPFTAADRYMEQQEVKKLGFTREKGVPYAAAKAFPSGELADRGINHVVFSNVLPNRVSLTSHMVARCVGNALIEADRVGAKSLAVPAIGTGFIAALQGFSMADSIEGTLLGLEEYAKDAVGERAIESLSLVIYAEPTEKAAGGVRDYLEAAIDRLPNVDRIAGETKEA